MSENETERDGIVTTDGVSSVVRADGVHIGHVMLADYDDTDAESIRSWNHTAPGVNVLLKSSPGSHHLWNLSIKPRDDIATDLLESSADPKAIAFGYQRGRWVVRVTPKRDGDGAEYKKSPEFVGAWANPAPYPQSEPHYRIARSFMSDDQRQRLKAEVESEGLEFTGDSIAIDRYQTMTDEAKERL